MAEYAYAAKIHGQTPQEETFPLLTYMGSLNTEKNSMSLFPCCWKKI